MLSDRNIFCPLGGGEKWRDPMPLRRFLFFFFGGHLPQTSGFRSAEQIRLADVRSTEVLSSVG